uniref:Uncharacterized protein n=1 Tax=Rhizophora mucronata TaxID=61149 RepID=A0A2P2P744_RHIMU
MCIYNTLVPFTKQEKILNFHLQKVLDFWDRTACRKYMVTKTSK